MLTEGSVLGGVISASAYADGVAFVASNRYTEGMTDTCAIDVRDGHVIWRQTAADDHLWLVAHANGVVYVGTTGSTLYALDGASGNVLWMTDVPDSIAGGPRSRRPLFVHGAISGRSAAAKPARAGDGVRRQLGTRSTFTTERWAPRRLHDRAVVHD